jgi:hypothetical protein
MIYKRSAKADLTEDHREAINYRSGPTDIPSTIGYRLSAIGYWLLAMRGARSRFTSKRPRSSESRPQQISEICPTRRP